MATTTYTPLYTTTLSSAQASVTFSSFSGYTDLVLVFNGGATVAADFQMQVNSDAADNYSRTWLTGNGSSASSNGASSVGYMRFDQNGYLGTSLTNNIIINVMNYSNSTTYKTLLSRSNTAATGTDAIVNLWRSTNSITTIYCYADGTTFLSGSTFTLYGIANADTGALATGGVITYDDTYFYHTFGSSGTFTPKQSLTADVLVVAGGGAGGVQYRGGGGGAGGLVYYSAQSLTAQAYTCTVGAGGAAHSGGTRNKGVDSTFQGLTAANGGGGGGDYGTATSAGQAGGSGGGGANQSSEEGIGGAATPAGQGNAGGAALAPNGGGGGGAGVAGGNATNPVSGTGGNGLSTYSSFGSVTNTGQNVSGTYYYAGGGSGAFYTPQGATGGAAGYGGGGAGSYGNGTNGTANTGGGGGGSAANTSGSGGSGVIIVRYAKA